MSIGALRTVRKDLTKRRGGCRQTRHGLLIAA